MLPHRRASDSEEITKLLIRVSYCESSIRMMIESNRETVESMTKLTENMGRIAEVLEAWANAKGFFSTLKFFSMVGKVLLPIVALFAAVWFLGKTGQWDWNP